MTDGDTFKTLLSVLAIPGLLIGLLGVASHYRPQPLRRLHLLIWKPRCRSLTWEDVPSGPLRQGVRDGCCAGGPSHPHNLASIRRHDRTPHCWDGTIGDVLNVAWGIALRKEKFPSDLENHHHFIRIDRPTLLAFMLGAIPEEFPQPFSRIQHSDAAMYKVSIQGSHVIVHIRGTHQRRLSKQDCIGLINGYPPWYRETLIINYPSELPPWTMRHPLAQGREFTRRGGWVIAVALSDTKPIPIYLPDPADPSAKRGSMLSRACERVLEVLERQDIEDFCRANSKIAEYKSAIRYIKKSIATNTDSASWYVQAPDAGLMELEWWRTVCRAAIEIFDKPPKIPNREDRDTSGDISLQLGRLGIDSQKVDVAAQLLLHWASRGVFETVAYTKNPGRELILDSRLDDVSEIYLEDCRSM